MKLPEKLEVAGDNDTRRDQHDRTAPDKTVDYNDGRRRLAHMSLGGWKVRTNRDQIMKGAQKWTDDHPDMKAKCHEALCPRTYGFIAKVRVRADALRDIVWRMAKELQDEKRDTPPTWASLERSPETGAAKRAIKDAVNSAKNKFPMLDIDSTSVSTPAVRSARCTRRNPRGGCGRRHGSRWASIWRSSSGRKRHDGRRWRRRAEGQRAADDHRHAELELQQHAPLGGALTSVRARPPNLLLQEVRVPRHARGPQRTATLGTAIR